MPFPKRNKTTAELNKQIEKYGLFWSPTNPPLWIELCMIKKGGQWKTTKGKTVGNGLFFHFKKAISILWPEVKQHRWFDFILEHWLKHTYVGIIGPKNCVAGDTRIFNPLTGEQPTIQSLQESGIAPVVLTLEGPVKAGVPFVKGEEELYEVILSNGSRFKATAEHRVLTASGYSPISSLRIGSILLGYDASHPRSTSGTSQSVPFSDDRSFFQTIPNSQSGYPAYPCSCGELLPQDASIGQGVSPLPCGAQERIYGYAGEDASDYKCSGSHSCQLERPLSRDDFWLRPDPQFGICESRHFGEENDERIFVRSRSWPQFRSGSHLHQSVLEPVPGSFRRHRYHVLAWGQCNTKEVSVSSIKMVGMGKFFDIQVPGPNHYFAEGAIHHNSGKTHCAAIFHLMDYYCFPDETTVLMCSTTREMLENRIFGEVKKYHKMAVQRYSWIPGHLIEGRQRIVTDDKMDGEEGRDFRCGFIGIPLKKGNQFVGISDIIGIKNKRKRLCGDELQCLPKAFIDGTANFIEPGADCKVTGMGNPAETTDSLGVLCEPHVTLGGWEGGIDQTPKTKAWKTRFENGICIQLPGSDSPNNDVPEGGEITFPFLMTRDQMAKDALTWGKDDWHYTMFNEGRMPRGQGSRRVITRQLCLRNHAMEEPIWLNSTRTYITALDAAYRAVGGDRCVLMRLAFGPESKPPPDGGDLVKQAILDQNTDRPPGQIILAILDLIIIPIKASDFESPEDQITMFCKTQHDLWKIPPENFFFDAGMRTSLVSSMAKLWSPQVNTIDFGGKPTTRPVSSAIDVPCCDYYSKFVTELWYSTRLVIDAEQLRGLGESTMMEGCAREWKTVSGNKIEVETKADMKVKTGYSPDLFDTLVTGVEGARQKGFIIRNMSSKSAKRQDLSWKRELKEQAEKLWRGSQLIQT